MHMRDWGRRVTLHRWLNDRRLSWLLRGISLACAAYAVVIVATLFSGDTSAPWLPVNEHKVEGAFLLAFAALAIAAGVSGLIVMRKSRKRTEGGPAEQRLPRWPALESSYQLGVRWTLSGWRLWTFGLFLYAPTIPWLWLNFTKEKGEPIWGDVPFWNEASFMDFWVMLHASFFSCYCFVLKGREVRRGKERIKVADEYLAIREERLYQEFDVVCTRFLQQQQEWKSRKTAELYEQILDQQARGVLPCPNCDEHGKSA